MTTNWRAVSHVISKILWTPPTPAHTSPLWHIPEQTIFKKTKTDHKYQSSSAKQNNTVSKWTNICACWSLHNGTKIISKSHFKHKVQIWIARPQNLKKYPVFFLNYLCLVLLQVPKCFVPVQIFRASPIIWLHLVPLQKLLCRHKNQFYWMQIIF